MPFYFAGIIWNEVWAEMSIFPGFFEILGKSWPTHLSPKWPNFIANRGSKLAKSCGGLCQQEET